MVGVGHGELQKTRHSNYYFKRPDAKWIYVTRSRLLKMALLKTFESHFGISVQFYIRNEG